MPMQVILLIRHDLFRLGLKHLLSHCPQPIVIIETAVLDKALTAFEKKPDSTILIVDSKLKEGMGLEIAASILNVYPKARILLVTHHKLTHSTCEAMAELGIKGYIHHDMEVKDYQQAFNNLLKGKSAFFS